MKRDTQCVHSGTVKDREQGGVNSPIYTSSAYNYLDRDEPAYPRYFNTPNQQAVVEKVCALEGAEAGLLFSSGMAALTTAILAMVNPGDHVVMLDELYGGSHHFATSDLKRLGVETTFVATNAEAVGAAIRENTSLIVIESPTNPLLGIVDITAIAQMARARSVTTLIDNTFATPILQNPLALGIDLVMHSGTKYLGGHSDICCGMVLGARVLLDRILQVARNLGGSLNASTCYLLERSLKTLALRVERQCDNANRLAAFLDNHGKINRVNYPGLKSHPQHALAAKQMSAFGAMLSFEVDGAGTEARDLLNRLKLISAAVSLGGVETTICSPAETSHFKISAAERERIGIRDSLLRLSVGIEDARDLIADLNQALRG